MQYIIVTINFMKVNAVFLYVYKFYESKCCVSVCRKINKVDMHPSIIIIIFSQALYKIITYQNTVYVATYICIHTYIIPCSSDVQLPSSVYCIRTVDIDATTYKYYASISYINIHFNFFCYVASYSWLKDF